MKIQIFGEDASATSLTLFIEKAVKSSARVTKLSFAAHGSLANNQELLKAAEKYERATRRQFDHAFYLLDARNAEDMPQLQLKGPQPDETAATFGQRAQAAFVATMKKRAGLTDDDPGFHPRVLVWELESLVIPCLDAFHLGPPASDEVRHPAKLLENRVREHEQRKYRKSGVDIYLRRIAQDSALRDEVLKSNASIAAIINEILRL